MTDIHSFAPGEPLPAGKLQEAAGEWGTWTPALTVVSGTNPTLGTGSTSVGDWHNNNGLITAQFGVTFGASGVNPGSGIYRLSVPFPLEPAWNSARLICGTAAVWDASPTAVRPRAIRWVDATHIVFTSDDGTNVANNVPWTFAAGDSLWGVFVYRSAAP